MPHMCSEPESNRQILPGNIKYQASLAWIVSSPEELFGKVVLATRFRLAWQHNGGNERLNHGVALPGADLFEHLFPHHGTGSMCQACPAACVLNPKKMLLVVVHTCKKCEKALHTSAMS